jgi:hypothetical protein
MIAEQTKQSEPPMKKPYNKGKHIFKNYTMTYQKDSIPLCKKTKIQIMNKQGEFSQIKSGIFLSYSLFL